MNYETFYKDLLNLTKEQITNNKLLKLFKKYSSRISVFNLMNLITASDNTFEWVSKKWTKLGNKMQVKTFIFRMKALDTDFSTYVGNIDNNDLKEYIFNLINININNITRNIYSDV